MRGLALALLVATFMASSSLPVATAGQGGGGQIWHLTDSPGCADTGGSDLVGVGNHGTLRMDRGNGTGAGDVVVAPGAPVTFCANEPALVDVGFRGDFPVQLVFREPHPLPDHAILALCQNAVVVGITDLVDYLILRLGVYRPGIGFVEIAEIPHVLACEEYQPLVDVSTSPARVTVNEPLWRTGVNGVVFEDQEFIVRAGDYLAFQVEKSVPQLPLGANVNVAATLVTTMRDPIVSALPLQTSSGLPGAGPIPAGGVLPPIIPDDRSPSVLGSPESDPGYPVPELPTLALAGLGLVAVGLVTRRRA